MEGKPVYVKNHEFHFTLAPTQQGGWTMSVLHIDHSSAPPTELRSAIDIEFESETQAMRYAELVAAEMANRRDEARACSRSRVRPREGAV